MEERFVPASALCTTYMCFNLWIDHTQRTADLYSRIDEVERMLDSFWPKYHRISMEERINQASAFSTTYM
jgi:hypothetical protein